MKKTPGETGKVPPAAARPPRVLVPDLAEHRGASEEILLRKDERDHVRTRRLRDGDDVIVMDGKGTRGRARVARGGTAVVLSSFEAPPGLPSWFPGEPSLRITVLLACAEPSRVEWAVEKGTECGAAGFVLLEAARSQRAHVVQLASRRPRLSRIAAEAAKQCDRTIIPTVEGPESAGSFLRGWNGSVLLAQPGAPDLDRSAIPRSGTLALAIGPEGGFDPSELLLFEGSGALSFSLGPRILRLETAVVAALTRLVGTE